jgi:hypothetical protein
VGIPRDVTAAMETAIGERCFLCDPCRDIIKQDSRSNELVARKLLASKKVSMEEEGMLASITRQRLLKTQQTEKIQYVKR